jgi:hypothetical protein
MDHGKRLPARGGSLRDFVADFAYNPILRNEMSIRKKTAESDESAGAWLNSLEIK